MLDLFVFPDNKTWEFGQIHIAMEKPHLVIRKGMSLFLDVLIITILLASTGSVGVSGTCSASSCLNNGLCVDESGHTTCHCPLLFVGDICQYDVEPILTTVCMVNSSALSDEACELAVDTPGNIVSGLQTEWVADGNEDGAGAFIVLNLMAEYSVIGMKYRQRCDPQNQISRMAVSLNDGTIVVQDMPCSPTPNCADEQGATLLFDHAVPETHMVKIVVMELCSHGKLADIGFRDITVFTSIDECTLGPCQNSGTCIENDLGYTCNCDGTGFEGNNCEQKENYCASSPCSNNGTCVNSATGPNCICPVRYLGKYCNFDQGCINVNPAIRSNCGYKGIRRRQCLRRGCCFDKKVRRAIWCFDPVPADPCTFLNCFNHGTCQQTSPNDAVCECDNGWRGTFCDIEEEGETTCDVAQKTECGWRGINRWVCETVNQCCFVPKGKTYWCFHKQKLV